ncbi:dynamin family protein [Nannochloropsis gaditana]|uniref:Dynamin family protein n=1 Tax=Nannochloropsis gaditana TaxID=72520 RepID=W7TS85_9STRA|nr:dynamin family protein [Nannochloropsis gaditana]
MLLGLRKTALNSRDSIPRRSWRKYGSYACRHLFCGTTLQAVRWREASSTLGHAHHNIASHRRTHHFPSYDDGFSCPVSVRFCPFSSSSRPPPPPPTSSPSRRSSSVKPVTQSTKAPVRDATPILTDAQASIVKEEQALLERLHRVLTSMEAGQEDLDILKDAICQVEDLFMVCVVGEFNAGKSRFINALLGDKYLKEGVTPTTAKICFVKHVDRAGAPTRYADAQGQMIDEVEEKLLDVPLLQNLALVDTPGTNAVIQRHSQLTYRIVPRADVVLFLTSIARPFSESERTFLTSIAQWHKKVVLVLNQCDLRSREDVEEVTEYVRAHARAVLGTEADLKVFPISAKLALEAKVVAKPHSPTVGPGALAWQASNFAALQQYLDTLLTDEAKLQSKLLNPIGVAERLLDEARHTLDERRKLLSSDVATLALVDEQMTAFMRDMERDVEREKGMIDKCLRDMVDRAEEFLAAHMTLTNYQELWDSQAFAKRFQQQVVGNLATVVDEIVLDMSELVAQRARTQSRAVLDFLGRRPGARHGQMVGSVTETRFEGIRAEVLSKLTADVGEVMNTYDKDKEFVKLSEEIKTGVMATAAVEAGAATVGALVATHALDVTGILFSSMKNSLLLLKHFQFLPFYLFLVALFIPCCHSWHCNPTMEGSSLPPVLLYWAW